VEPVSILAIVALIAATTLCGVGVWAAIEIARTAREVRGSVGQTTERIVPLLDKADITVDAVNAELLRVDPRSSTRRPRSSRRWRIAFARRGRTANERQSRQPGTSRSWRSTTA